MDNLELLELKRQWRKENKKEKRIVDIIYGLTLEQIKTIRDIKQKADDGSYEFWKNYVIELEKCNWGK